MKPDPAGVFEILRIFGVNKDQVLYFGDTNTDMMTAHNAGVDCPTGEYDAAAFRTAGDAGEKL